MATWQQGINSGGFLAGIGGQNSNAPKASDVSEALAYIRQNNEMERSGRNNIGLQALQGLGSVAQTYQAAKQQEADAAFQKEYAAAIQSGDRQQVRDLMTKYPGQLEKIQSGMKWADEDQRNSIGTLAAGARLASSSPEAMQSWLQNNANELARVGVDPNNVAQMYQQNPSGFGEFVDHLGMAALGPIDYFNVQDKMAGREIDRGRLAETIRSNQAGEALQARGQDISASNSAADRQIRLMQLKQDALVKQANRETNDLKRQELQLKIDANQQALQEKRQQVQKGKDMSYEAAKLARSIASNPQLDVVTGSIQSRLPKFDGESLDIINQAQQLQSMLTAGNLGLLKGAMSDKDIAFLQSMSSGLNVGDNGIKGSYEATKKKLNIIADKLERNLGGYVPEGEPASAGTQSPQAATTKSWSDLP